ncbi:hypothetical protein SH611_05905 [Geminicoccaceae bacterium 1502E]|nr:hypothetical protein [Geminicoccaceae bacterium 1502E]
MPAGNISFFGLLSAKAEWAGRRFAVLSGNIANADTPGRLPLDLPAFADALARNRPGMVRTDARHLAPAGGQGSDGARPARSWETAPSGNGVVLEEEMQKLATTQLDYRLAIDLYGKHLGMLRTALGAGR